MLGTRGAANTLRLRNFIPNSGYGDEVWITLSTSSLGVFHEYEVLWRNGMSIAKRDHGVESVSQTIMVPTDALHVRFVNYSSPINLQVDWVYLRQYRDPEPTTTVPAWASRSNDIQETVQVIGTGPLTFAWVNVDPAFGLTVDTKDTLSSVQVVRYPIDHPHANGCPPQSGNVCQATLKYWEMHATGTGYSLSLTLPWTTPDDQDKICFWTGSGQDWDCTMTGYGNPANTITRSGITELSDWAVGSNYAPTAITLESFTASSSNNWALPTLVGSGLLGCVLTLGWLASRQRKKAL